MHDGGARLAEELQLKTKEAAAAAELRAQVSTLTEHMAKAIRERDEVVARFASWDEERLKLLGALKEKEETISVLNASFKGMLRKP